MARQSGMGALLCAAVAFWVGFVAGGQKRKRAKKAPKQVAAPLGWTSCCRRETPTARQHVGRFSLVVPE